MAFAEQKIVVFIICFQNLIYFHLCVYAHECSGRGGLERASDLLELELQFPNVGPGNQTWAFCKNILRSHFFSP